MTSKAFGDLTPTLQILVTTEFSLPCGAATLASCSPPMLPSGPLCLLFLDIPLFSVFFLPFLQVSTPRVT